MAKIGRGLERPVLSLVVQFRQFRRVVRRTKDFQIIAGFVLAMSKATKPAPALPIRICPMPRAPEASQFVRTRSMRGSILVPRFFLRGAEPARHQHGHVLEKIAIVFGESVQLFTLHVDHSDDLTVRLRS